MINDLPVISILLALVSALVMSFAATPLVKIFAEKIGAMDVPNEARRIHDHPIPRMGGLAIFLGFILSVVLFADITKPVQGILFGAIVIVAVGAIDDIVNLPAWIKFIVQIVAAGIAVAHGVVIENLMNPFFWSDVDHLALHFLSIPVSIVWIVAITNSVNFIDGLDGLAVGVSAIDSVTMLVIAMIVADGNVAIILAALAGACVGFMPYNLNPARIFMGDTGALLLGYILATVSVLGLFKFYAVISFAVPLLILAVPLFDTVFAFFRRIAKGQNPMTADRGHFHHRLLNLGLSQKHAVAILYSISAVLGLSAVVITTSGELKMLILVVAVTLACIIGVFAMRGVINGNGGNHHSSPEKTEDNKPD